MKIKVGICDWHSWFAWHPVMLRDGTWVWLETVSRRWSLGDWRYEVVDQDFD